MSLEIDTNEYNNFSQIKFDKPVSCVNGYLSKINDYTINTPYVKIKDIIFSNDSNEIYFQLSNDSESRKFFQLIYDIEEYILLNTEINSIEWFKKKIPSDILYKNQIKPWIIDRNGDIILKVNIEDNKNFRKINKNDNLSLTITLGGIKFHSKIFGSVWNCINYKSVEDDYNLFNNIEEDELFRINNQINEELENSEQINGQLENSEQINEQLENSEQTNKQLENSEQTNEQINEQTNVLTNGLTSEPINELTNQEDIINLEKCHINNNNPILRKKSHKKKRKKKKIIYANKVKYISSYS